MDAVELEELAVILADLFFDVTLPEISSEAKSSLRLSIQGDVIRAFELDDVIALGLVFVIAPSVSVWSRVKLSSAHAKRKASMSLICVLISVKWDMFCSFLLMFRQSNNRANAGLG